MKYRSCAGNLTRLKTNDSNLAYLRNICERSYKFLSYQPNFPPPSYTSASWESSGGRAVNVNYEIHKKGHGNHK